MDRMTPESTRFVLTWGITPAPRKPVRAFSLQFIEFFSVIGELLLSLFVFSNLLALGDGGHLRSAS
jgi:hypothetical protein